MHDQIEPYVAHKMLKSNICKETIILEYLFSLESQILEKQLK